MIALVGVLVVLGSPVAALVGLLLAVEAVQRRRMALIARQIAVTDAIHREFGAIVAPVVQRAGRGWRVVLPMLPGHPNIARVVALAAETLEGVRPVEVALVAPWGPAPRRRAAQNRERIASAMSA